jgi:OFA family oxalate/formate antiporter-like MFS transporter
VKLFGIDALVAGGVSPEEAPPIAATAAGVFLALFNGAGRITWGIASDRVGWRRSAVAMCILQAIAMFAFFWMGQTAALLFLGAALIGFNFGGNFAIFPVATADTFGPKNVGKNYGWVFLAYGLAGIVGPIMAGRFKDLGADKGVDAWLPAFLISGVLCVAAALIVSRVRPPRHAQSA